VVDGPSLSMSGVRFGYPGGPMFLGPIDLAINPGELLAIVGPNGAGKSTLLRLAGGLLHPGGGSILVAGRALDSLPRSERARMIAFLPQHCDAPPELTSRQVVLLGRYPHRGYRFFDSPQDHRIAEEAMGTTEALRFADRAIGTLSAGERQRVHLAAAVAQQPRLLMLDEPTSALDPYHQISVFGLLRRMCREDGRGVAVVTHDLNLAGQYADSILLLREGRATATGTPHQVLRPATLRSVYGVEFESFDLASDGLRRVFPIACNGGRPA